MPNEETKIRTGGGPHPIDSNFSLGAFGDVAQGVAGTGVQNRVLSNFGIPPAGRVLTQGTTAADGMGTTTGTARTPQAIGAAAPAPVAAARAFIEPDEVLPAPGSMQHFLEKYVGNFAIFEFLIGTQQLMTKQGIIAQVGPGCVTLYDDVTGLQTLCDAYSIKFVTVFDCQTTPKNLRNARR